MKFLENQLSVQKILRKNDVDDLKSQILRWEVKYEEDVEQVKSEYDRL